MIYIYCFVLPVVMLPISVNGTHTTITRRSATARLTMNILVGDDCILTFLYTTNTTDILPTKPNKNTAEYAIQNNTVTSAEYLI